MWRVILRAIRVADDIRRPMLVGLSAFLLFFGGLGEIVIDPSTGRGGEDRPGFDQGAGQPADHAAP